MAAKCAERREEYQTTILLLHNEYRSGEAACLALNKHTVLGVAILDAAFVPLPGLADALKAEAAKLPRLSLRLISEKVSARDWARYVEVAMRGQFRKKLRQVGWEYLAPPLGEDFTALDGTFAEASSSSARQIKVQEKVLKRASGGKEGMLRANMRRSDNSSYSAEEIGTAKQSLFRISQFFFFRVIW